MLKKIIIGSVIFTISFITGRLLEKPSKESSLNESQESTIASTSQLNNSNQESHNSTNQPMNKFSSPYINSPIKHVTLTIDQVDKSLREKMSSDHKQIYSKILIITKSKALACGLVLPFYRNEFENPDEISSQMLKQILTTPEKSLKNIINILETDILRNDEMAMQRSSLVRLASIIAPPEERDRIISSELQYEAKTLAPPQKEIVTENDFRVEASSMFNKMDPSTHLAINNVNIYVNTFIEKSKGTPGYIEKLASLIDSQPNLVVKAALTKQVITQQPELQSQLLSIVKINPNFLKPETVSKKSGADIPFPAMPQ